MWKNSIGNSIRFSIHLNQRRSKTKKKAATLIKQNRLHCNSIYPVCLSVCVCVCAAHKAISKHLSTVYIARSVYKSFHLRTTFTFTRGHIHFRHYCCEKCNFINIPIRRTPFSLPPSLSIIIPFGLFLVLFSF